MNNKTQTEGLTNGDIVAKIKTTKGEISLKLFKTEALKTVVNFMGHSNNGYYENVIFHRVIEGFMIQGGDPEGTGRGGESIYGPKFEDEISPNLSNIRGSISMANAGPNTNGSQFFINQADNTSLDGRHAVFGQVIEGIDIVDDIAGVKTDKMDRPLEDIKIISISLHIYKDKNLEDYNFNLEEELKEIEIKNKQRIESLKTREVKNGDMVSMHYIGILEENGEEFDNSHKRGSTLDFEVGVGMMIPGFEREIIGMKIGEEKTFVLEPNDAYGEYSKENTQTIEKDKLGDFINAGFELKVGEKLPTMYGEFEIIEVDENNVTLDVNHHLAGKTLKFTTQLVNFNN